MISCWFKRCHNCGERIWPWQNSVRIPVTKGTQYLYTLGGSYWGGVDDDGNPVYPEPGEVRKIRTVFHHWSCYEKNPRLVLESPFAGEEE